MTKPSSFRYFKKKPRGDPPRGDGLHPVPAMMTVALLPRVNPASAQIQFFSIPTQPPRQADEKQVGGVTSRRTGALR